MSEPRAQGKHAGLTREQVLRAAVGLVDRHGAAALSMRKLASELDVEAMTLYHHVKNKQALEDALVEHVLTESLSHTATFTSWHEALHSYACNLHRGLEAHPGTVILFASRPGLTEQNSAAIERLLQMLVDAGFDPDVGLRIIYAVASMIIGQHLARPVDEIGELDDHLPAGEFPRFREALRSGVPSIESRVSLAVDALIIGFDAIRRT